MRAAENDDPQIISALMDTVESGVLEVWQELDGLEQTDPAMHIDEMTIPDLRGGFLLVIQGIMHIEALLQRNQGQITGSEFMPQFLDALAGDLPEAQLKALITNVEQIAYIGVPDFATLTLLNDDFRRRWESQTRQAAITSLANIRAFYQDEVDSLLLQKKDMTLFADVRQVGTTPQAGDVLATIANMWLISACVEPAITKVAMNVMGDVIFFSRSTGDFVRAVARTLINALFDFDTMNVTQIELRRLHDPNWDNFEKWQIPRDLIGKKPKIEEYWHDIIAPFIAKNGRGMFYEEPKA
jgi:hypothetical protein